MSTSFAGEPIIGAYYIPDSRELQNIYGTNTSNAVTRFLEPEETLDKRPDNRPGLRRRYLEFVYQDGNIIPRATQSRLEDFVITSFVEEHPDELFVGKTWCVVKVQMPPHPRNEGQYITAVDYALVEGYDAVFIEPFNLNHLCSQWIGILSFIHGLFGGYLSLSLLATLYSEPGNPGLTALGIFNSLLLKLYKKYVMGDPISRYRNLDHTSNDDMLMMFRMTEIVDIHGGFHNILLKDEEGERSRLNWMKLLIGAQMCLAFYKYSFGMLLRHSFPNRII